MVVAYLGGKAIHLVRVENAEDVHRHRRALDAGDSAAVVGVHLRSLGRDVFRALIITWVGLLVAGVGPLWIPLNLQGSIYLGIAAVGAAIAAAVAGVGRLTGRRSGLRWFVLGLAGGLAGVVFG